MSPELEIGGFEMMTLVEANIVPRYYQYHVLKKGVLAWSKSGFTIIYLYSERMLHMLPPTQCTT